MRTTRHAFRPVHALAVLLLAAAIFPGSPASAQPASFGQTAPDPNRLSVVQLAVPDVLEDEIIVTLPIAGEEKTVRFQKHSVRSSKFRILTQVDDGSLVEVEAPPIRTLRGSVANDKDSVAAGALTEFGLEAAIHLADGRTFGLEPSRKFDERAPRDEYFVYPTESLADPLVPFECGTADEVPWSSGSPLVAASGAAGCGGDFCVAELAIDADYSFYSARGSRDATTDVIETWINLVNIQFENEVDISHRLTTLIIRSSSSSDPYSGTNHLVEFRDHWNENHSDIPRDVAHRFTVASGAGGTAYVGAVGNLPWAYGFTNVYEGSQLLTCEAHIVSHELGHNWNASHCDCYDPPYTMNPSFPPCSFRFHPDLTIPVIESFRDGLSVLDGGVINDDAHNALAVSSGTYNTSTEHATNDGESSCGSSGSSPDIWFTYTPAWNGTLDIDTFGSSFDTVLSLHNAALPPSTFTELSCNDDSGGLQSRIATWVEAGETYRIRVSGYNGASGDVVFNVSGPAIETPRNDDCPDAKVIGPCVYHGTTTSASNDSTGSCTSSYGNDVWFVYTAERSEILSLDTCGSDFDTVISVHTGCPGTSSNRIACNDDSRDGDCYYQSSVEFLAVRYETYYIRLGGYGSEAGNYRLAVTGPAHAYDMCGSALDIEEGTHYGDLQGATADGDSSCGGSRNQRDVWYRFVSDKLGTLWVDTCGSNDLRGQDTGIDTVISLHDGCPGDESSMIACNDDMFSSCSGDRGDLFDSAVSMDVVPGDVVYIRVSRYSSYQAATEFVLNVNIDPNAAIEQCQGRDGVDTLTINGNNGVTSDHVLNIGLYQPFNIDIAKPAAGGRGKFIVHMNAGAPDASTLYPHPSNLGWTCFSFLIYDTGTPLAIWNSIGKDRVIGSNHYFGTPTPNPGRAPVRLLNRPYGDASNLPPGTVVTLQGIILNPAASGDKPASVTNGIVVVFE